MCKYLYMHRSIYNIYTFMIIMSIVLFNKLNKMAPVNSVYTSTFKKLYTICFILT